MQILPDELSFKILKAQKSSFFISGPKSNFHSFRIESGPETGLELEVTKNE